MKWLADRHIYFSRPGKIRIQAGDFLEFTDSAEVEPHVGVYAGQSLCPMGTFSYSHSQLPRKLRVGRYCSIAHGVDAQLIGHALDRVSTLEALCEPNDPVMRNFLRAEGVDLSIEEHITQAKPSPVIENDVWIGAHVLILPGVRIQTGAVVAAGSIVTRDIGPYEIVAGNPARLVRKRFDASIVEALLASEWWRYSPAAFAGLPMDKPGEFAARFLQRRAELKPYTPARARMIDMPHD